MEPSAQVVELWFKHEQVAMHFNELLIQFRLRCWAGPVRSERSPRQSSVPGSLTLVTDIGYGSLWRLA